MFVMSAKTEAAAAEANRNGTESNLVPNLATGVVLSATALAARTSEMPRFAHHTKDLPELAQLAINTGGHPILGFIGGLSAKYVMDKASDAGKKAYVYLGLGLAGAISIDLAVEAGQDKLMPADKPFYDPSKLPESSRDMAAAVVGFAIAAAINWPRKSNGSPQES